MNIKPRICQQKWQLEHHNVSLNFMNGTRKCENHRTSENALLLCCDDIYWTFLQGFFERIFWPDRHRRRK